VFGRRAAGRLLVFLLVPLTVRATACRREIAVEEITLRDGAWVLPAGADLTAESLRRDLEERRARLRAEAGPVTRPEAVRRAFIETKAFLFDDRLYDRAAGRWRVDEFLDRGEKEFGGYDQVIIWQSYPRLGIDERNQFDCYRNLPGGLAAVREWVETCRRRGVRSVVTYNPWDRHTRGGGEHFGELAALLEATGADGAYLDTMHAVPPDWPEKLKARLGRTVYFESEGSPEGRNVPDMHCCWGQGYPVSPPSQVFELRWLFPQQKIFLTHNRHKRDHWDEVRCALFTGTGVLVWENVFGNDTSWTERDKQLLRAVKPVLQEFHECFSSSDWQPLVRSGREGLSVNRWPGTGRTVYTLCWDGREPCEDPLFAAAPGMTYVDLVTGRELKAIAGSVAGTVGARSVGAVLEVAELSDALRARLRKVSPGRLPAYAKADVRKLPPPGEPKRSQRLGKYGGEKPAEMPAGMVWVPGGEFTMTVSHRWHGARCYDHRGWDRKGPALKMAGFAIDAHPVTNAQFSEFVRASGYRPKDAAGFLKHWKDGEVPAGLERHPVVHVSLDDARAYAKWADRRLPTEAEWQYAAGGADGRAWPWGGEPGEAFDPKRVNGTGRTAPVGSFPGDESPCGARDMCGHVWQWVDDVYSDRVHTFTVIKGGSFFRLPAEASKWYVDSGPQPVTSHAKVPLLAPSVDRFSTVGFRCAVD
jgi:formylglycine-generating enzyme required for sulfatase activity